MSAVNFAYAACLLVSIAGMAILDWRYRLFWWADRRRAAIVHLGGFAVFVAWDVHGIAAGIFKRGDSPYMTGWNLAPHLPVEELLFLFFLCWLTMVLYTGSGRLLAHLRPPAQPAQGAGTSGTAAKNPEHRAGA